tara:strand:+ start:110 stop:460 length:351 start_codon:yes stop_codon:yes gene_type:complete
MEIFAFFIVGFLLIPFEWFFSKLASLIFDHELACDIFAAFIMLAAGGLISHFGWFQVYYNSSAESVGAKTVGGEIEFWSKVKEFGEAMQTTLGINTVIFTIIAYFVLKFIVNALRR